MNVHPSTSPQTALSLSNLATEKTALKPSKLRQFWTELLSLKGIRAWLENGLIRGNEPKICQKCDRDGHAYFQVYDRATDQWHHFNSEAEVRAWLERRYYD